MSQLSKRLALVSVISLMAATAEAAPTLRGNITVTDQLVTVADMFDDAGALAEMAIFSAPAPGTTGKVDIATIRSAAARVGITSFEANGFASVNVTRAGMIVDEALLKDLVVADLTARGLIGSDVNANVQFSRFLDPIQVSTNGVAARLEGMRYTAGSRDFSARFVLADNSRVIDVTGTIDMTIEMPHLAANLPAGTILLPEHLVMRPVPVGSGQCLCACPARTTGRYGAQPPEPRRHDAASQRRQPADCRRQERARDHYLSPRPHDPDGQGPGHHQCQPRLEPPGA